jgi:hypothetical protein
MSRQLVVTSQNDLATVGGRPSTSLRTRTELAEVISLDQNPAAVYLASLSGKSRRTMQQALNAICGVLGMPDPNEGLKPRDKQRVNDDNKRLITGAFSPEQCQGHPGAGRVCHHGNP